jgi:ABC-type multidrug transport system ATPase subunit
MSESILKALMQLFAIIAHVNKDGVTDSSREIVESYLKLQLNKTQVLEYLKLFDEYVAFHHRDITKKDGTKVRKRTSSNSVKVLRICQAINEELEQEQKILVVLQLLEFISFGEEITEKELDFVQTVGDIFNIPEDEYRNAHNFCLEPSLDKIPFKENILIIDNNSEPPLPGFKHIHYHNLEGRLTILHIASTNMYAFKYVGETDLYLNGHSILLSRTYLLPKGSAIRSSRLGTIYYSDIVSKFIAEQIDQKVEFVANSVEFRFKGSENGIHHFNFKESGGELVGIMGGSGVGKSTLLNVLNGNLKPQTGSITINGYNIHEDKDNLEGVIGFVPQDDLLIDELTVYQNLYFNAKLCFRDFDNEEINKAVLKVLEDLDLKEIKDLTVGSPLNKFISGGQRKRLNIALELIREPLVMFVDEPTSGLSSMDSQMVMDLLKEQTLKGKLVIINIHQPSSDIFKMFDKLLIMDKGGYLIYNGNPGDSVVYFKTMSNHVNATESECYHCGNINPERVLQIVESKVVDEYGRVTRNRKQSPKDWAELYQKHIEKDKAFDIHEGEVPKNNFRIPGKFKQFLVFSKRNILSKLANRQYMLINFLEAPLLALFLAYFTKYAEGTTDNPGQYIFANNDNVTIYLFMAVVVAIFIGLTVSAEEIIKDRQLLKREKFLNLSRFSYINSKVIILFIISAVQTLTFIFIGNVIMEIKGMYFAHWFALFSASCAANLIGLNISAALNSVITIYILIPFLVVPQLLFSGTMVKFDKLNKSISSHEHVPVIGDLMTSRWAYEAIAVKQFRDNDYEKHFFYLEKKKSEANYITAYLIPQLNNKISKITYQENEDAKKRNINLLRYEVGRLNKMTPKYPFEELDKINYEDYSAGLLKRVQDHLKLWSRYYKKKQNKALGLLDKRLQELAEELGGHDKLVELKKNHYNEFLSSMVLNKNDLTKIYDNGDKFVQLMNPIYKAPEKNNGRAHFYASEKTLGGFAFDTYWFNMIVVWLTTLLLYIVLLFDGLRKLFNMLSMIKKRG